MSAVVKICNIWACDNRDEGFFRRGFELKRIPQKAVLRIFCDTGYELFLNDRFVAALDEHNNTRDYDVRVFMRPGKNLIAVHALNHGGHRGLCVELRLDGRRSICTDSRWLSSGGEVWDWRNFDCDESSGWTPAVCLPLECAGHEQWSSRPGSEPQLVMPVYFNAPYLTGAVPKAVASPFFETRRSNAPVPEAVKALVGEAGYRKSQEMYPPKLRRAEHFFDADAFGVKPLEEVSFEAADYYRGRAFIVDFGSENVGFLRFRAKSAGRMRYRILYGESVNECFSAPPRGSLLHAMLVEEGGFFAGDHCFESRNRVGFRFVRVEFFDCEKEVTLRDFAVKNSVYQVDYKGYFSCSDPMLNRIWEVGRNTLHWCMQEYYLDGVKRDRLLWTGDTRLEALINYYLFGDARLFAFCWRSIASCQYADGAIPSAMVTGSSIIWDYVMLWLIALREYGLYTGDGKLAAGLAPNVARAAEWLMGKAGRDHLISVPENPYWTWMVVLNNTVGKDLYINRLYLESLRSAAALLKKSMPPVSARFEATAAATAAAVAKLEKKLGRNVEAKRFASQSLELFEQISGLFDRGCPDQALSDIKKFWSPVIEAGYDTFPEAPSANVGMPEEVNKDLNVERFSYCHGWTASPCVMLTRGVFGVRPLAPGFRRFSVKVQLGWLEFAEAVVPTPREPIVLKAEKTDNDKVVLQLAVPAGCVAEVEFGGDVVAFQAGMHRITL